MTRGDPLVLQEHGVFQAEGVASFASESDPTDVAVTIQIIDGIVGVTNENHSGTGRDWSSDRVEVDQYFKYGVGLYKADIEVSGPGGTCTFVAYVKLDGNPLTKPIGLAGAGMVVAGAAGAALVKPRAPRSPRKKAAVLAQVQPQVGEWSQPWPYEESELSRVSRFGEAAPPCFGTLVQLVLVAPVLAMGAAGGSTSGGRTISRARFCETCGVELHEGARFCERCGAAVLFGETGASIPASVPAAGFGERGPGFCEACGASLHGDARYCEQCGTAVPEPGVAGRVAPAPAAAAGPTTTATGWSTIVRLHGNPILGFLCGMLFGLGAVILLWQYAVWTLATWNVVVVPVAIGAVVALWLWRGTRLRISSPAASLP